MAETPGKMVALGVVFALLPIPFVAMRFQIRRKTRIQVAWDDWLIVFSLLATVTLGVLLIVAASLGDEGGHSPVGPDGNPMLTHLETVRTQTTFANTVVQVLALGPTKLSVLLFYRRIFSGARFNIVSWIMMILVVSWTIAFFLTNILTCVPVRPSLPDAVNESMGATCMSGEIDMYLAQSYADFSLDFIILILPLPIILQLQMKMARRIQVALVFLTGLMTVAASVARTAVQYGVGRQFESGNMDAANFEAPIIYWPLVEASVGIVAASLPTLRPLVDVWAKSTWMQSLRSLLYRSAASTSRSTLKDAPLESRSPSTSTSSALKQTTDSQHTEEVPLPSSVIRKTTDFGVYREPL